MKGGGIYEKGKENNDGNRRDFYGYEAKEGISVGANKLT